MHDAGSAARALVRPIAVGLHVTLIVADDVGRHPPAAARLIAIEQHRSLRRAAARYPHVAGGGVVAVRFLEHLYRGLVDLQLRSAAQLLEQQFPAAVRRRRRRRSSSPTSCAATVLLPSARTAVPWRYNRSASQELGGGDERQQPRAGQPLRDQRRRRRKPPVPLVYLRRPEPSQ